MLQQYLPLAVLKQVKMSWTTETLNTRWGCNSTYRLRYWNRILDDAIQRFTSLLQQYLPLAVLKLHNYMEDLGALQQFVATVLTACGIETHLHDLWLNWLPYVSCNSTYRLRYWNWIVFSFWIPFLPCCNSTYRLRYWNWRSRRSFWVSYVSCNSTYRLRYWNRNPAAPSRGNIDAVATVLTACGIETRRSYLPC